MQCMETPAEVSGVFLRIVVLQHLGDAALLPGAVLDAQPDVLATKVVENVRILEDLLSQ